MVNKFWNRGSVVGIVTVLLTGRFGARIPVGVRDFPLLRNVETGSGTHTAPPVRWVLGSFTGAKRPGVRS